MTLAFVLGAGGFLGRHVFDALRLTPGIEAVEGARVEPTRNRGPRVVVLDLATATVEEVTRCLTDLRPAVVVNCAGRTIGTATELTLANVVTVARLVDAIELSDLHVRLIHIGSAAEYGPGLSGTPVSESAPTDPVSSYGVTKLAATRLVDLATKRGVLDGAVLRVFNAIGPGMPDHTLPGAAVRLLAGAMTVGKVTVEMGPLMTVRDFVDVRDIGRAVAAACVVRRLPAPIINVGSGQGHASRDLVEEIAKRLGYQGAITERAAGSPRSTDVPWQVADISLALQALPWHPTYDLAASCDAIVEGTISSA
jgi:nucleoside-diphosphate-sugar epimerase